MSKRCELQKEYYQQYGNYKGNGKYCDKYVSWLENEVLALRKTDVISNSLNTYHIETKDGSGNFNFFTQAKDHKKALRRLETDSSDWKRIVKADRDLVITIKKIG